MKISTLISTVAVAATLAFSSFCASANASYTYSDIVTTSTFDKTIDLTGLSAGTYDVSGTFLSGNIALVGAFLNTTPLFSNFTFDTTAQSLGFNFSGFVYNGTSPLKFLLTGLKNPLVSTPGLYTGSLNFVSAVPEAETYGMMLLGLGLMGFVVYRRRD